MVANENGDDFPTILKTIRVSGGERGMYQLVRHKSKCTNSDMTLGIFLPSCHHLIEEDNESGSTPVVFWLGGLSTAGDYLSTFIVKIGPKAFESAEKHKVAVVIPDTSPRGPGIPDAPGDDLGHGAGYFLDATEEPWKENYQMYTYITQELPELLSKHYGLVYRSISGFSMGGYGALNIAIKNPYDWISVSALAPICNPTACPWGERFMSAYLGSVDAGKDFDPTVLLKRRHTPIVEYDTIFIDQGSNDEMFQQHQLHPKNFMDAAKKCRQLVRYNLRKGYNHSVVFVAGVIDKHLAFHAERLYKRIHLAPSLWTGFTCTAGKEITCKAYVVRAPNEGSIETVTVLPPGPHQVRLKVVAATICPIDINHMNGSDAEAIYPCIYGHEASLIVESVGEGVENLRPGDHAICCHLRQCHDCIFCRNSKTNLCNKGHKTLADGLLPDGKTAFRDFNGLPILHFYGCAPFSEYTVMSKFNCVKVSQHGPLDKICMFSCGVSTGLGAVWNTCRVEKESTVAVFGLGAVGMSVIQAAQMAGASQIIAIDINPNKFATATQLGATHCVDSTQIEIPIQKHVAGVMTEYGVDYTFECTGNTEVMRAALESAARAWGVSCILGIGTMGEELSTRPYFMVTGRIWKGSVLGGFKSHRDLPNLVQQCIKGEIDLNPYVTHQFEGIEKLPDAIACSTGNCIRAIVKY